MAPSREPQGQPTLRLPRLRPPRQCRALPRVRDVDPGAHGRMIRRLAKLAVVPLLIAAALLTIASCADLPRPSWEIGDFRHDEWVVLVGYGGARLLHSVNGKTLVSTPLFVSFKPLAVVFALLSFALFVLSDRQDRGERGFPVGPAQE